MGVTYAGQPAVLDFDRTVEKFVAARWPESRWPTAQDRLDFESTADPFSGTNSARFHLPYPGVPAPRLNEIIVPTGASRYARGLFLFGREQMAAIAQAVWGYSGGFITVEGSLEWGLSNNFAPLVISYNRQFSWPMYALPPVRPDATGGNNLWILPLVDARYAMAKTPISGQSSQGETWGQLIARINSQSLPISHGPLTPQVGVPDRETFDNPGLSYGVAVDSIALSIGLRAVPKPTPYGLGCSLDAHFDSPNLTTAAELWAGGNVPANIRPSKIKFSGRTVVDHSNVCRGRYSYEKSSAFGAGPLVPLVHSSWFVKHFRERATAAPIVPVVDSVSRNQFELACDYLAEKYAQWNDRCYAISCPGVVLWNPSGRDDYISYRVGGPDGLDSVSTHIQSLPPNFYPITSLAQDPSVYVHPTATSVFSLTEQEGDDHWALAQIAPADGPHFGADRRAVLVKILSLDCLPDLRECDEILASYQCSTDLGDTTGLPGWLFNPFTQSLDGWEVEATLDDSITGLTATGSAEFVKVRSTFPHVLEPPGIDENRKIAFQNPWRIDGICNSPVILRLVTDDCRPIVDEQGQETGSCGTSAPAEPRWEIRDASLRKARLILFQYTGGTPDILDYWHGEDPESCGSPVIVEYPLGEPCEPCPVFATLDPHSGVYLAHATRSAMLGIPEELDVVNSVGYDDSGCDINYVRQSILAFPCGSEPSSGSSSPVLTSLDVVTGVSLVPPVPECEGYAEYTWNPSTYQWDLTTPCASGCTSSPPSGIPADPGVAGDPVPSPCVNPPESPASPGYLSFARSSILVCGYTAASPATIELAECPEEPTPS